MIQALKSMRWTIVVGVCLGLLLAPIGQTWWVTAIAYYDDAYPVVRMSGSIVKRTEDSVFIRIVGEKLRQCKYVRLQAYTKNGDDTLVDVYARREDMLEKGDTKPVGKYDIGVWQIWPVYGTAIVMLYVTHACNGRIVSTKISEVHV